jgi:hypothetical protein
MASDSAAPGLCDQAREHLKQLRNTDGEAVARHAVAADPRSDDAHTLLGIALCRQGKTAEGIESLGQAVVLNPANITARSNLATARHQAGHLPAARAEWQAVLGLDPNNTKARGALAVVEWQMQHAGPGQAVGAQAFDLPNTGGPAPAQPTQPTHTAAAVRYDLAGNPIPVEASPLGAGQGQGSASTGSASGMLGGTYYEPAAQAPYGAGHGGGRSGGPGGARYGAGRTGGYAPPATGDDPGGWSLDNVVAILTGPSAFMAEQRGHYGIAKPLLFSVINAAIVGVAVLVAVMARMGSAMNQAGGSGAGLAFGAGIVGGLIGMVTGLAVGIAGQFVVAGLVHLLVRMLGGREPYGATYRALVYAGVPTSFGYLFGIVAMMVSPALVMIGAVIVLASLVWSLVVAVIGLAELNGVSSLAAFAALFLAGIAILGVSFFAGMVLGGVTQALTGALPFRSYPSGPTSSPFGPGQSPLQQPGGFRSGPSMYRGPSGFGPGSRAMPGYPGPP